MSRKRIDGTTADLPFAETAGSPVWEQLPNEPQKAFSAFTIYRDLGPLRSKRSALEKYRAAKPAQTAKSRSLPENWRRWEREFRWDERVRAYDAHLERHQRLESEEFLAQSRIRYARDLVQEIEACGKQIKELLDGPMGAGEIRVPLPGGGLKIVRRDDLRAYKELWTARHAAATLLFGPVAPDHTHTTAVQVINSVSCGADLPPGISASDNLESLVIKRGFSDEEDKA